jgi:hypothetical protein
MSLAVTQGNFKQVVLESSLPDLGWIFGRIGADHAR